MTRRSAHTQRAEARIIYTERRRIMIEVKNRKLEQFYYAHGIDFISCRKDPEDALTVWEYEDNEENRRILEEFRTAIRRREAQKQQGKYQRVF